MSAVLFAVCTFTAHAAVITYNDGLESPTINPFWTVIQSNGPVATSGDLSHTGNQSAKFTSVSGGQRNMWLTHTFAVPVQGSFSVWFYDYAPNQETLYEQLSLANSSQPAVNALLGTMDYDAYCYVALSNGTGPNGSCGIYPQVSTTNVHRTAGWHQLTMDVTTLAVTLSVDGSPVHSNPGNYSFDSVSSV